MSCAVSVCTCVEVGGCIVAESVGSRGEGGSGEDTTVAGGPVPRVTLQRRSIRSLHSGIMYTLTHAQQGITCLVCPLLFFHG